jgi:hypothetical protein
MQFTLKTIVPRAVLVAVTILGAREYVVAPNAIDASVEPPPHFLPLPAALDTLCSAVDTTMVRERGLDTGAVAFARANGYFNWCVPEYDDDQRFHDGLANSAEYGSIAHVLAVPGLEALRTTSQFNGQFIQVAIVDVEAPVSGDLAPYHDLGLTEHNCLYLQHRTKFGGLWQEWMALMVPPDKSLVCPATPQASPIQTELEVTVEPPYANAGSDADYPPTTRFIEGTGGLTLIGVKCAVAWCVIGPRGFAGVPLSAHASASGMPSKAQGFVKGWFDDQVLGVPDGSGKFGIHRRIRASAVPDAALGSLKVADFIVPVGTQSYKVVGRTYFPDSVPSDSKYVKTFGFSEGVNVVALRAEFHPVSTLNPKPDTVWFAQVTDAKGHVTNDIPTRRTDHRKFDQAGNLVLASIPATMRWRWFDADEDLWFECDLGCCLAGVK